MCFITTKVIICYCFTNYSMSNKIFFKQLFIPVCTVLFTLPFIYLLYAKSASVSLANGSLYYNTPLVDTMSCLLFYICIALLLNSPTVDNKNGTLYSISAILCMIY